MITPGRRMRMGNGLNGAIISGPKKPSAAPSNRFPALSDRLSSNHSAHKASDNHGAGNRRFMAAPSAWRLSLQDWAPGVSP